jgi:hypothetical protein
MSNEISKFEVTDHCELASRGGFVIGQIVEGVIRIGMLVETGLDPSQLKISGVEFLDNISERKHWNALLFVEKPSLAFVKQAFPVGTVIEAK